MKTTLHLFLTATAALLLMTGCASSGSGRAGGPSALVQETEGEAEIASGEKWRALRTGRRVREGALLRTGDNSSIDLHFGDYGGIMRVTPNSQILIEKFGWADRSTGRVMHVLIDLQRGRVRGDTLNPVPNSLFQVRTLGGTFDLK